MFPYSQTTTPAFNAHMKAQFSLFADMSKKLFDTAQKINELNFQVAQTVIEEAITGTRQLLEANDPYEALSISASQAQPAAEKVRAYQQHLANIAAGTQVDLVKTAESHMSETTRTATDVVNEVAKKASEETEKVTQRQKAAMEKLSNPIMKPKDDSSGSRKNL